MSRPTQGLPLSAFIGTEKDASCSQHKSRPSATRIDHHGYLSSGFKLGKNPGFQFCRSAWADGSRAACVFFSSDKAEKGKPWVGRLILVDQFKRKQKKESRLLFNGWAARHNRISSDYFLRTFGRSERTIRRNVYCVRCR